MRSHRHLVSWMICGLVGLAGFNLGCAGKAGRVQLAETPLPKNVFSIAGEVRAFTAKGPAGSRGQARASLNSAKKQVGDFKTAQVVAFNAKGRPIGISRVAVAPDGSATINATSGNRYLIYPNFNPHLQATYEVLCKLGKEGIPGLIIPKICEQILCADQPFRASELVRRVEGLDRYISGNELGDETIGGFGLRDHPGIPAPPGGGTICDSCIPQNVIYPVKPCLNVSLPEPGHVCGIGDLVVYSRDDGAGAGTRIHVMRGDGTGDHLIPAAGVTGAEPNVDLTGQKIVFDHDNKLFTMNVDGSNLTEVPDTAGAHSPVWHRDFPQNAFVAFTAPMSDTNPQTAIFMVRIGTQQRVQVTFPATGENDDMAAIFDTKTVLFVRNKVDASGHPVIQLFMQEIGEVPPQPVQLTNIPHSQIREPVCGHLADSNRLVAFVVKLAPLAPDEIHVCRLNFDDTLTTLHTIVSNGPARNVFGIDFSSDDECMFFQAFSLEATIPQLDNFLEIFRSSLDGSTQTRVTTNQVRDGVPAVIGRQSQ